MPLYRRVEPNAMLLDFKCVEFVEELIYGELRSKPLPALTALQEEYKEKEMRLITIALFHTVLLLGIALRRAPITRSGPSSTPIRRCS